MKAVRGYSKKTRLLIIHPEQDEVVGDAYMKEYDSIGGIIVEWMGGDHSWSGKRQRRQLIQRAKDFFSND